MATMGRRRKNDQGLEPRVYEKHGAFYYVHRAPVRWERLSENKDEANAKARHYNDPGNTHGTLLYWLREFLADCKARVAAGTLAQRTYEDYRDAIEPKLRKDGQPSKNGALAAYFAPPIRPQDVTPDMVQDFLELNAAAGRATQGNRAKAALSACFSWMLRKGKAPGLLVNPCLRASGVKRNTETKRDLYVEHDWFREVYELAVPSVRLMMDLCYRTLQRPESDIVLWTTRVLAVERGQRVLKFTQNKTKRKLSVVLTPGLDAEVRRALGPVPKIDQHLIHDRNGEPYTYDGIAGMLRRYIGKANKLRVARGEPRMPSWGFRDLKGKGATDMWLSGEPIEKIQHLCGHENKETTEIYVKQRWSVAAQPNRVEMGGPRPV